MLLSAKDPVMGPATPGNPEDDEIRSISAAIKRRLCQLCEVMNNCDWHFTSPLGQYFKARVSPDFRAQFDNVLGILDWEGQCQVWRQWRAEQPDLHYVVCGTSCHVEREKGNAILYAEIMITLNGGIRLGGLSETRWKQREDGEWVLVNFAGIRGMLQNGGFV